MFLRILKNSIFLCLREIIYLRDARNANIRYLL